MNGICNTNFKDANTFRQVLRAMCRRWKQHAAASLLHGKKRTVQLGDGQFDPIDLAYVVAIENEFPLDRNFEDEFRTAMTIKLHTDNAEDAALSRVRTQVLWDCCTRYLIKLMPLVMRETFSMPKMPLYHLRSDADGLLRGRNHVVIEMMDAPTRMPPPQEQADFRPSAELIRQASMQEQMPFLVLGDLNALDAANDPE